jgi:hypothetical protein
MYRTGGIGIFKKRMLACNVQDRFKNHILNKIISNKGERGNLKIASYIYILLLFLVIAGLFINKYP